MKTKEKKTIFQSNIKEIDNGERNIITVEIGNWLIGQVGTKIEVFKYISTKKENNF